MNSISLPSVLCLDDDRRMLEILTKMLSRLPLEYRAALDPDEAIELARQRPPDLLILDLMLPGMSGWEALEKIRAECEPGSPRVIVLTAKDAAYERLVAANVARVDLFLNKPFDMTELARHILRLLDLPPGPGWPNAPGEGGTDVAGNSGTDVAGNVSTPRTGGEDQ